VIYNILKIAVVQRIKQYGCWLLFRSARPFSPILLQKRLRPGSRSIWLLMLSVFYIKCCI